MKGVVILNLIYLFIFFFIWGTITVTAYPMLRNYLPEIFADLQASLGITEEENQAKMKEWGYFLMDLIWYVILPISVIVYLFVFR